MMAKVTSGVLFNLAAGTIRYSSSLIGDEKRAAAALVRISKMCAKVTGRTAQEMSTLHDTLAFMPVRGDTGAWVAGEA
jgi:hypothetical protein